MKASIEIINASKIECTSDWSWDSQNNGWEGLHLWYVCKGEVSITTSKYEYSLGENDVFLFDLKENHICRHDPENPITVYTVYFQVEGLEDIKIEQACLKNASLIGEMIKHIVTLYKEKAPQNLEPWLEAILTEFIKEIHPEVQRNFVTEQIYQLMKNKNAKMYSLEELCEITGYSKNQLIRIVKKETGKTPMKYQMDYKIEYAKSLLIYSNETIESISAQIGFKDGNYFSKVFKQHTGMKPKDFKKIKGK